MCYIKSLKFNLLVVCILVLSFGDITNAQINIPLQFDTGCLNSSIQSGYNLLKFDDKYDQEKGYGWIIPPKFSFNSKQFLATTMRNELTIDGVTGKEIAFKANLNSGEWWFTFWMEAGNDYTNTAQLYINNEKKEINWHPFEIGESGSNEPMKIYRVYQTLVNIDSESFEYKLVGGKDSIRICGFSIIPKVKPKNIEEETLLALVKSAGQYRSKTSLNDVYNHLLKLELSSHNNPFLIYWKQQLNLLREGERIVEMQGWEWARQITGLSIFSRLKQAIAIFDGIIANNKSDKNLLLEKALWYRGKILYDLHLESGGSANDEVAKVDLAQLYKYYPNDQVLAMLNGEKIDIPDPCDYMFSSSNAPRWSVLQREIYHRLSNEIDWWVNVRQAGNGELGGKIGDDVELLRWWSSFLVTGNETAKHGWKQVAEAVWNSPKVYKGYSKRVYDVEHASEYISDSTPELILIDNDSTYFKRLYYTAEHFDKLWTEVNKNGNRFFKSAWYSSTEVDDSQGRNIDVDYNSRAVKPLRYLAWATRESYFVNLLHEWSLAWVNASLSTKKGKPKGILPSSIRGYDESFNSDGSNWYETNSYWNYFDWHHSVGAKILDNIIFTYTLTNDTKLLEPMNLTLKYIDQFVSNNSDFDQKKYKKGTDGWVVQQMVKNYGFWNVVEKWRLFVNESKYDDLLKKYGNDYTKYKLTSEISFIENNLTKTLEEIRYNTPLRTSLVLHTDRVRTPGANTLKAMLTGDGTPEASSPYYAITWENSDRDFTALVNNFSDSTFSAKLFSHSKNEYLLSARLWLLKKGKYNLEITNSENKVLTQQTFVINRAGDRIQFNLPVDELLFMKIKKSE